MEKAVQVFQPVMKNPNNFWLKFKWIFFFCLLGGGSNCWGYSESNQNSLPSICQRSKIPLHSYFTIIPVVKFTEANLPCILIHIENKTVLAELDLGFRGNFSFSKELLEQIPSKKYIRSKKIFGIGGHEYTKKIFHMPFVKMDGAIFSDLTLDEEVEEFLDNSSIVSKRDKPTSPHESCRIGWEIFQHMGLLLDLGNSQIALCDSISTVKKRKYAAVDFFEVSLNTQRGLVELEASTEKGSLRCVLDTGSTWNILNENNKEGIDIEDEENTTEFSDFTMNKRNLGSLVFHHIPIHLPIQIDAILGMEFFQDHIVFLDFQRQRAYIAP